MKIALVIFITLALAGCALLSLHMGVIPVPWRALLTDWQDGREHYYVLMEYRLPRLLLALFVGAALAVAGVLVQGIVRNPLASPDILGINHAASLASVGGISSKEARPLSTCQTYSAAMACASSGSASRISKSLSSNGASAGMAALLNLPEKHSPACSVIQKRQAE